MQKQISASNVVKNGIIAGISLVLLSILGGFFSRQGMGWYNTLVHPEATPPKWVFAIVWPILFTLLAYTLFLLRQRYRQSNERTLLQGLLLINMVLNTAWTYLFFTMHAIDLALIDLIVLQLTNIIFIAATWKNARLLAIVMIPYTVWLFVALYLNYQIYLLNP